MKNKLNKDMNNQAMIKRAVSPTINSVGQRPAKLKTNKNNHKPLK